MSEFFDATILVVDDSPEDLDMVGELLKDYSQKVATNGEKALKIAASDHPPNLILLDIVMPEMDGLEACKRLKSDPKTKDIPVIFITAKNQPEDILKGFEAGGVDYVTKPFNPPELLARVRTHIQLKHTENELRDLLRMKDKLISIIGHDLRGPIGNFTIVMKILLDGETQLSLDRIKNYLMLMKESSEGIFNLLEDLLSWANSQQKLVQFIPTKNDLLKIVNENINVLRGMAKNKGIVLKNEINETKGVFCDKNSISTVLRNLISNALKFTENDGIITISAKEEGSFIRISIRDTGVGMSHEHVNKLFKQESIFSTPGINGEKGNGLGLLLCKDFVVRNGGEIEVESEIGKGSAFHFTLPSSNDI